MLTTDDVLADTDEWDARFYHRVMATQQVDLAMQLGAFLPDDLEGLIIDGGCGSGLVDIALLQRYPQTHLCAVDLSAQMLTIAQREVNQEFADRVCYRQADLQNFIMPNSAVCFFSNAAMHWVKDHELMFQNIFATLQPGGFLASQMAYCGPHNAPWYAQLHALLQSVPYRGHAADMVSPVELIHPENEVRALQNAGFENVTVVPHSYVFTFQSAAEHRLFMEKVILRGPMAHIPVPSLRTMLLDTAIAYSDSTIGPLKQCYESLRCIARRPRTH